MMHPPCASDVASPLGRELTRCAEICERTLDAFVADEHTAGTTPFAAAVMLAAAGLRTAARAADAADAERLELATTIAATLCRDGAEIVRRHGLDDRLLRCAEALDRAAYLCSSGRGRT